MKRAQTQTPIFFYSTRRYSYQYEYCSPVHDESSQADADSGSEKGKNKKITKPGG